MDLHDHGYNAFQAIRKALVLRYLVEFRSKGYFFISLISSRESPSTIGFHILDAQ